MKTINHDLIRTTGNTPYEFWVYDSKQAQWVPLSDQYFSKTLPGYTALNSKAREKARHKYIKAANIIEKIKIPRKFPNITKKLYLKHSPNAQSALCLCELFEEQRTGYLLLADLLCGMHMTAIQAVEPGFHPAITVDSASQHVVEIFTEIMQSIFTISRGGNKRITYRRSCTLDYRPQPGEFPRHIQDFARIKVKIKGHPKFKNPVSYVDSTVLVIGADASQMREALPYLSKSAVILLNSAPGDLAPTRLSSSRAMAYAPEILSQIEQKAKGIASLFHYWQEEALDHEGTWAHQIVQEARASFGGLDSRYIRVELDPKKLRDAIRYRVFLSFLDAVETAQFMTPEELTPYRQGAKEVFDPAPPEPVAIRHAEDSDVFLEIMRALVKDPPAPVIPEGKQFIKKDRPLAAWRSISGERYLVFLEADWAKTYAKAVRSIKGIDVSFLQRDHWCRDIQKILCEQGLIKTASSGYRYRYDLLENGKRDSTYVIAIPAHLLEN